MRSLRGAIVTEQGNFDKNTKQTKYKSQFRKGLPKIKRSPFLTFKKFHLHN